MLFMSSTYSKYANEKLLPLFGRKKDTRIFRTKTLHMSRTFSLDEKEKEIKELKCENQKLKNQLKKTKEEVKIFEKKRDFQNAEIEKQQRKYMEIIEALNKENELKCENQKLKNQLKKTKKEVKRLEKKKDFQNAEIEKQ
ncbi:hypothetical protein Peur_028194 [Populus x canadensis]